MPAERGVRRGLEKETTALETTTRSRFRDRGDAAAVDVHQHLWTEPLLDALSARSAPPFVRRSNGELLLHIAGEPPAVLDEEATSVERRIARLDQDGIDLALVCLSSPAGIEALPREEAEPLLHAYAAGTAELPVRFQAWGAIPLDGARPDDVDRVLGAGAVGVSLPAGAIASVGGLDRLGPVLERVEELGAPVLVHPGPSPWAPPGRLEPGSPPWWTALTGYVASMSAAWFAWVTAGRPAHPRLRVLFAMLAGLAPLHAERLEARGGGVAAPVDPLTFFDTSSYGVRALDAMVRSLGVEQLVYGSDRPVVEPRPFPLGPAAREVVVAAAPARLLAGVEVPA